MGPWKTRGKVGTESSALYGCIYTPKIRVIKKLEKSAFCVTPYAYVTHRGRTRHSVPESPGAIFWCEAKVPSELSNKSTYAYAKQAQFEQNSLNRQNGSFCVKGRFNTSRAAHKATAYSDSP